MTGPRHIPPVDPDVGLLDVEEATGPEIVLEGEGKDPGPYPKGTFSKIVSGMVVFVALIVATYVVPALHWARPWTPDDPVPYWNILGRELGLGESETDLAQAEKAAQKVARAEAIARQVEQEEEETPIEDREAIAVSPEAEEDAFPGYEPHPDDELEVPQSLEMPEPTALDPFFESLAKSEAGFEGAITRVTQWGDSVIANDNVTSTLRAKMQRRFGDAGHGFHLIAKPNASYRHRGIRFWGGDDWSRCYIINKCRKDRHYGLGGTTVWSAGGAETNFATSTKAPYGRKWSRIELWYAGHDRGGKVQLRVDDEEPTIVDTRLEDAGDALDALKDQWFELDVSDAEHSLELRAGGGGLVRLYGVVFERDGPGVVWDGMAQLGAFTSRMLYFEPEHLKAQVEHRDPNLMVFMFGGNDLLLKKSQLDTLRDNFREMLERFRAGDEARPCLVVSPVDHGIRTSGRIESVPMVDEVTELQREVAAEAGCAFFDTKAAMGGAGSVARWRRANPPLISGDLAHLTDAGQRVIGHMIYLALMEQYRAYRERGLPKLSPEDAQ